MSESSVIDKPDPTSLYRHYNKNGDLLYIGVSHSQMARLAQHKESSHWYYEITRIEIEHYPTRESALAAEREAIQKENPQHNIHMKPRADVRAIATHAAISRKTIGRNLVEFKPIYTDREAAELLKVPVTRLAKEFDACRIGGFYQPKIMWAPTQVKPKLMFTGWDLIDYLERLCTPENEYERKTA